VLVDTHAHLHDPAFDADRAAVLARARAAGVTAFLTIGTDVATSEAAIGLATTEPDVYAAVGIHPHDARTADATALDRIAALATAPKVVAVGEIGLDHYRDHSPRDAQRAALVAHLQLARRLGKPVLLHCREAHSELLDVCHAEGVTAVGGILHCFSGDLAVARRGLDLGLLISIAGPVTYPSARRLRATARTCAGRFRLPERGGARRRRTRWSRPAHRASCRARHRNALRDPSNGGSRWWPSTAGTGRRPAGSGRALKTRFQSRARHAGRVRLAGRDRTMASAR